MRISKLEDEFDEDFSEQLLNVSLDKSISGSSLLHKSLYNIDLDSTEGVQRVLELLPLMDPEILNDIYREIFPMYPVDTLSPRMARIELKGYFMDVLAGDSDEQSGEEVTQEPMALEEGGEPPPDEAPAPPEGAEPGADQGPGEDGVPEQE